MNMMTLSSRHRSRNSKSKFDPWRSEAEHATSRSRRLPQCCYSSTHHKLTLSMRLPDPSRDPKTLLICGSRTPAWIMFSYRLSLVIPVLTKPCVWIVTKLCWGTFRWHCVTHACRIYPCFTWGGGGVSTPYQPLKSCNPVRHNLFHCPLIRGEGVFVVTNYSDFTNMTHV